MSDALILGVSLGAFTMITTLVTIMLNGSEARRQAKLLHQLKTEQDKLDGKIDSHHKEIDGKLTRLVELEKRVSFIEGEKQGKSDQIISDKQNQPIVNYDKDKPEEKSTGTGVKKNLNEAKENSQKTTDKIEQVKKKLDEI